MKAGLTSKSEAAILKWISDVTDMLCNLPAPAVTCETSEALANLRDELNKSIKTKSNKRPQTKMKRKLLTITILAGLTFSAFAPPDPSPNLAIPLHKLREPIVATPEPAPTPTLFGPKEFTVDLSGTYTTIESEGIGRVLETSKSDGDFGAVVGATKFFTRNFGVGAEVGIRDLNEIEEIDYAAAFVVARLPLDTVFEKIPIINRSAPYVVAGAGQGFHISEQFGVAGIGCEIRLTPRIGMFGDARFIFTDEKAEGLLVSRIGVRVVF